MSRAQTLATAEADGTEKASIGLRGAHWTQKPLSAMTERDWRIFREDFDIRVKGGKAPLPLRSWEEGHLADSITQVILTLYLNVTRHTEYYVLYYDAILMLRASIVLILNEAVLCMLLNRNIQQM
jgi:hypothetical protein